MVRRSVLVTVAVVGLLIGTAVPASAKAPGPQGVPALVGVVRDGCTNGRVAGLVVTLTDTATGAVVAPDKTTTGHFVFKNPGPQGSPSLVLQVNAPGYAPLGDPAAPGVMVTKPPSPNLPARQQMTIGLVTNIFLAPNPLPANCPFAAKHPPNPNALVGTVRDATTGARIAGLSVSACFPPDPCVSADKVTTGHFVFKDPGPQGSPSFVLQVSAAGYPAPLGDPAAPGVTIIKNPGPVGLPAVQSMSIGLVAQIHL